MDLIISGAGAARLLAESGGHRWQRIPPTERGGRVHTSTVTVVAMELGRETATHIDERDIEIETMRGSGAGGQHRNRTESAVRMRHRPTGLEVRICSERSQHRNKDIAREILTARIMSAARQSQHHRVADARKQLAGSGERGDKVRTYRVRDGQVVDHVSGRRMRLIDVQKGQLP